MSRILVLGSLPSSLLNFRGALLADLVSKNYEVHVAAPRLLSDKKTCDRLKKMGVICHDITISRRGMNPLLELMTFFSILNLIRKINPEIFIGYTVKPVIWGGVAAYLSGVPKRVLLITGVGYIFSEEARNRMPFIGDILMKLYSLSAKNSSLIFFQNPDDRACLMNMGVISKKSNTKVVNGSGVDLSHYKKEKFPSGPVKFLLIARLLRSKGIYEYVQASIKVRQAWPDVEFHLVGGLESGPDGIPEKQVIAWHERGVVIWHGHQEDVRPFLRNCHVYVLPSYGEGTPRSILEAMSAGRPIITSDAPGCRETVIHNVNGFLVPVKSAHDLATMMEIFLNDTEIIYVMGEKSRIIAEKKYDVRKVNLEMIEEIECL